MRDVSEHDVREHDVRVGVRHVRHKQVQCICLPKARECSAERRVAVGQVATAQVRTVIRGVGRPSCPLVQEKHFPEAALPFVPSAPHPTAPSWLIFISICAAGLTRVSFEKIHIDGSAVN